MPWAGGTFNLLYNWLADRDTGIKIRADKMMAQEQDLADGMEQTLLRNGVNSPTADIDWGGHLIKNLGIPVNAGDALPFQHGVNLASTPWVLWGRVTELGYTGSYVSGSSFKVGPGDQRTIWHIGRRIRAGGSVYGTIVASAISGPDTLVTVETDTVTQIPNNTPLQLEYGFEPFIQPAYLPPRACVRAHNSGDQGLPNGPATKITLDVEDIDTLGEYDAQTSTFTARFTGFYFAHVRTAFLSTAGELVIRTGIAQSIPSTWGNSLAILHLPTAKAGQNYTIDSVGIFKMNKGDQLWGSVSQTFGTTAVVVAGSSGQSFLEIYRLA